MKTFFIILPIFLICLIYYVYPTSALNIFNTNYQIAQQQQQQQQQQRSYYASPYSQGKTRPGEQTPYFPEKREQIRRMIDQYRYKRDDSKAKAKKKRDNNNKKKKETKCESKCTNTKDEVCGNDRRTYLNPCYFRCALEKKKDLRVQKRGSC